MNRALTNARPLQQTLIRQRIMRGEGRGIPSCLRPVAAVLATLGLWGGNAAAFQFEPNNPDTEIRWDNQIRYNVGWRVDERDRTLGDTWSLQGGDYKFDKGDVVTNRLDLLSEFDFVYKKNYGFRVSGSAWDDFAYNDDVTGNPAYQAAGLGTAYAGNRFTSSASRYYTHSAEFLDAFAFGRVDLGGAPLDVRVGRHNIYWGESLFTPIHGVSYSQGAVNFVKSLATPGSEAKELFLPRNQISALLRLNDTYSIAAQYALEWKPYRLPEGGTYLAATDYLFSGGTRISPITNAPFLGDLDNGPFAKPKNRGDWGLNAKAATGFGTIGLYYRKFDDKVPQFLSRANPTQYFSTYAKDVKLWGVSLSKLVSGGVSLGAEIVHRNNSVLNTVFGARDLARGDTWHGLVNAVAVIGKTPLFDLASLSGELTYSRLDKLRSDPSTFRSVDYVCAGVGGDPRGSWRDGCSTKDAWGLQISFTPTWYQVLPALDLSMPATYARGLKGNSPVPFGGNQNAGSWSLGLSADYQAKYTFSLAYTDYYGPSRAVSTPAAFAVPGIGPTVLGSSNGNGNLRDRGWLSLTFKTTL